MFKKNTMWFLLGFTLQATLFFVARAHWHPYELNATRDDCDSDILKHGSPQSAKKWGELRNIWRGVTNEHDEEHGESMFGFDQEMFERIWENQHPKDCKNSKFLISGDWEMGFGSEVHLYGVGLALAMNMNRVFILPPNRMDTSMTDKMHSGNKFEVDNDFCKSQGKENIECYYEPLTSCSISDALPGGSLQHLKELGLWDISPEDLEANSIRPEKALLVRYSNGGSRVVPDVFQQLIKCSPFHRDKHRYWWRSVSAAYILRPNAATRQVIAQHRSDATLAFDMEKEHCVSVYIRRGDKDTEMKLLLNDTMFFDAARVLWKSIEDVKADEKPKMFIGSEDPNVIKSAQAWGKENGWSILYSNLFDRASVSTGHSGAEQAAEIQKSGELIHNPMEYMSTIINLDAHLRCSAFVCTHESNFCRIIDEMRATVAAKAHRPYADFSCFNTLEPYQRGKTAFDCAFLGLVDVNW